MKDTTDEMEARYRAMIMALSPQERLKRGCAMFQTAKLLAIASIRQELGSAASEREIRRRVFLRFYGQDFSQEETSKILARIQHLY